MKKLNQEMNDLFHRSMDSHLRLAVTGLSRAGKTAFITSLVNQLLHTSTHDNLPLFAAARDKRIIGARRVPQDNLMVPRFAYDEAMDSLNGSPTAWPEPTRDVSEIRLAIKFKRTKGARRLISKESTLYLDIVDYPGEWLLDLPLLSLSFEEWSAKQIELLKGDRKQYAQDWLQENESVDLMVEGNEKLLANVSARFTDYLHRCKEAGLHWVQPGRFVLPGELEGAPVLQFYPVDHSKQTYENADKHSGYSLLKQRYEEYKKNVVKAFYKQHFSTFDRQIILVDCLQPLNVGPEAFNDMKMAIDQLMDSFKYGKSNFLRRLFSPKIDRLLFAATKVDHVTPEQHTNLLSLLQQMVHPAWQHTSFEGIEMQCMGIASIKATDAGFVNSQDKSIPAIQGIKLDGNELTIYPGEVPRKLPQREFWEAFDGKPAFEFHSFLPKPNPSDEPCAHIRLDKALEFLIGDKV
ncbi:YcjX family protein [Vibrio maerlii]|uniref:YcjX family protein n=1 Tax=Vibrio maerlii TaxID=2231648 RepID=UPI000E3EC95C|nr:YcjX family protein [Vibrio maerlii]